jgi:hypothetical protein
MTRPEIRIPTAADKLELNPPVRPAVEAVFLKLVSKYFAMKV